MSRSTLIGRALDSLDDAKTVASQLRNALEEVGVSVPRAKLLEVVARLCGAHHYDELQHRFKGKSAGDEIAWTGAAPELRLLTLPEVLLLTKPEGEGRLAEHLEFVDKSSLTRWCYAMGSDAIKPEALEAARRLVLGEPLRPTDSKWLSGASSGESIIDDANEGGALNVNAQALAQAIYLGAGRWSVGAHYYCRVSVNEPMLIERAGVPMDSSAMQRERLAAQRFTPPVEFASAGFEIFAVNAESQLLLRCLQLPQPAPVLEALQLALSEGAALRVRLAMLRSEQGGALRVIRLTGQRNELLAGLGWSGMRLQAVREAGGSRPDQDYSGEQGLARIWQEIRDWVARDDFTPTQGADASLSISAIRRAALAKWIRSS
jgi:hypothetical protein